MPRGGARQGTPGRSYGNRTDLASNRMPQTGVNTAAAGGMTAPTPAPTQPAQPPQQLGPGPDQVPRLDDPSAYPEQAVTDGLELGPGATGIMAPGPPSQVAIMLAGAYQAYPTPELRRTMYWLIQHGKL